MANPIYLTISAAGNYVIPLDPWVNPFNVSYDVNVGSATVSYAVNGTLDPITQTIGTGYGIVVEPNPQWDQSIVAAASTTSKSGTITQPLQALQIAVASITGSISVKVIQPFSIN